MSRPWLRGWWLAPGAHPKIPEGRKAGTHFGETGATPVAALVVAPMREQQIPLVAWLK